MVVNEVLTHTYPPQKDAIELFNTTDAQIDIGGWFLSDSTNYKKFRRGIESHRRLRLMSGFCAGHVPDFDWLVAPIANQDTRLAAVMNAARGTLRVQGWEVSGPVTEIFDLAAAEAARHGGAKT